MNFNSIMYKALFIFTILLSIISIFKIEIIDNIINISIIPIFTANILVILNSISTIIQNGTSDLKQYNKNFENDNTISEVEKREYIRDEIIYDEINHFFEIKFARFLSWVWVVLIISYFIMILLKDYLYPFVSRCNFNPITVLSSSLLILDVYYKDKISNKIIKILYKNSLKGEKYV